jgi:hypothetical protein
MSTVEDHTAHVELSSGDGRHYAWCSSPGCDWSSRHYDTPMEAIEARDNHERSAS